MTTVLPPWLTVLLATLPVISTALSVITAWLMLRTHDQVVRLEFNTNHIKDELVVTTRTLALLQGEAMGRAKERNEMDERSL